MSQKNTRSSRDAASWKRMKPLPVTGSPPLCACGCGEPTKLHIHGKKWKWNTYQRNHQNRGRKQSDAAKAAASERMKRDNPMKRPEVAAKVSATTKGRPANHSPQGLANIAAAARKRMLSDANPMKDPEIAQKVHRQNLARQGRSKTEDRMEKWATLAGVPLRYTGDGFMWLGGRNPDFRVGEKSCLEVTQRRIWAPQDGGVQERSPEGYGLDTIRHYLSVGWQSLVVFLPRRPRVNCPDGLSEALRFFTEGEWSGVWTGRGLLMYDESTDALVSTTSDAKTARRT